MHLSWDYESPTPLHKGILNRHNFFHYDTHPGSPTKLRAIAESRISTFQVNRHQYVLIPLIGEVLDRRKNDLSYKQWEAVSSQNTVPSKSVSNASQS